MQLPDPSDYEGTSTSGRYRLISTISKFHSKIFALWINFSVNAQYLRYVSLSHSARSSYSTTTIQVFFLLMNYKPFLLGAAIYAGFTLFKKKSAASGLVYSIASAQPSFDGITPIITLKVAIENSSDSQFLIKGIAGNVTANDNVIGNVSNYAQVNINPRSTSYYFLPVRLSIIGLATDIYNTLTGSGSLSQEIVFNGAANVDGFDVPLKLSFLVG